MILKSRIVHMSHERRQIRQGSRRRRGPERRARLENHRFGAAALIEVVLLPHNPRALERVDEPRLGLGVAQHGGLSRLGSGLGPRQEEEQPDAGGPGPGVRRRSEAVELVHHDGEVVVGAEGDEGVEVGVRELVLEGEGGRDGEGGGEVGGEGVEGGGGGGGAVDGDDAGLAAVVEEGLGVGPGGDAAAVAAHEAELLGGGGGGGGGPRRRGLRRRLHRAAAGGGRRRDLRRFVDQSSMRPTSVAYVP